MVDGQAWSFDANDALALMLGKRQAKFEFEYEITLYLLFVWALWPPPIPGTVDDQAYTDKTKESARILLNLARNLGIVVTITKMRTGHIPKDSRFKTLGDLINRMKISWYISFEKQFLEPLGGLRALLINTASLKRRRERIQSEWEAKIVERDLIRFSANMMLFNKVRVIDKVINEAFRRNIFDHEYRERKSDESGASKYHLGNAKKHRAAVLLYAFEQCLPDLVELKIYDRHFLKGLYDICHDRERVVDFLFYYQAVTNLLSPMRRRMPTVRNWDVFPGKLNATFGSGEYDKRIGDAHQRLQERAKFTPDQLKLLDLPFGTNP